MDALHVEAKIPCTPLFGDGAQIPAGLQELIRYHDIHLLIEPQWFDKIHFDTLDCGQSILLADQADIKEEVGADAKFNALPFLITQVLFLILISATADWADF
jgi:hypothetical protein